MNLLSQAGSEDESTTNLETLSNLFKNLENISLNDSNTAQNLAQILDNVQGWPKDVRQETASRCDTFLHCMRCM